MTQSNRDAHRMDDVTANAALPAPSRTASRIGYLVPEFPAQTHNFFMREIDALRVLGVDVAMVSTRRPVPSLMSTSWGVEAMRRTSYLFPLSISDVMMIAAEFVRAGPTGLRCWLRTLAASSGEGARGKLRLLALSLLGAKLLRIARRQGWSHLHVHSCADAANIALFASQLGRLSYGLTLHNPLRVYGGNQGLKWRHARYAIVITKAIEQEVHRTLGQDLPSTVVVAPMGVDPSVFSRKVAYQPYQGNGEFRVFCCARLNRAKGFLELVSSIGLLAERGVNVKLIVAGEDDHGGSGFRNELESAIHANRLHERIQLLGARSEDDVRAQLALAHAFVLASYEEPLGVALMEAMAMELPVVATNAGGVPELIRHGIEGLLVIPKDARALADALETLVRDPSASRRFGQLGRERVVVGFNSSRSAEILRAQLPAAHRGEGGP